MADIKLDLEEFNYNEDEITGEITKETKQIEDDKGLYIAYIMNISAMLFL
jgi:hypothetical protein